MKRLLVVGIIVVSLIIIYNLTTSIASLLKKQQLIDNAKRELAEEKKKNELLAEKLKKVGTDEFVEREARDKLYLVRPGEQVVMLPTNTAVKHQKASKQVLKPAYQQWWELFF